MSNNIVFQYWYDMRRRKETYPHYGELSRRSWELYAKRYNATYMFSLENYMNLNNMKRMQGYFEILRIIYDPFFDTYDKLLFVDMDSFPTRDAQNIFDVNIEEVLGVPERVIPGTRGAPPQWTEAGNNPYRRRLHIEKFESVGSFLKESDFPGSFNVRMINTGVLVFTKEARLRARKEWDNFRKWVDNDVTYDGKQYPDVIACDQPYINAMFNKYDFKVKQVSEEWNCPLHWYKDMTLIPKNLNIVHLSGHDGKEKFEDEWNKRALK